MDKLMQEIIDTLNRVEEIDPIELAAIIRRHNREIHDVSKHHSKKRLMRYFLEERETRSSTWHSWALSHDLEARLVKTLQVKPRRTASGVATITVITKPAPCSNACLYCPNDVRMPKSYLTDEPACQRAERNFFDPYLQVVARMKALREMGHETDKVEIIVLGGSWSDYEASYQVWFARELFRALNEDAYSQKAVDERRALYEHAGISSDADCIAKRTADTQRHVTKGDLSYNEGIEELYGANSPWCQVGSWQHASFEELEREQRSNEDARHRMVGLVVETRPDAINVESLAIMRRLGCTKVQIGVQTLQEEVLRRNGRTTDLASVRRAFELLRLFGFKIHAHFMANLPGSNPQADLKDYQRFVTDPAYVPDEVKLYPCVLVENARLNTEYGRGLWQPYDEESLVELLASEVLASPPYLRISRMIRDISAHDIKAGNQKTNLRQMVEARLKGATLASREIRMREISVEDIDLDTLRLEELAYVTSVSHERFLQWVGPDGRIAGFLRLSLPHPEALQSHEGLPIAEGESMIREVHVYGRVARIGDSGMGAQHTGLGRALVERACEIARAEGYTAVNVISAVGTRNYYRRLGFSDAGLYLRRPL